MIVTTTNSIENNSIKEYIGIINANVVVGTNIFSDYAASLTDVFGGYSETYQNKLNNIYEKVTNELIRKGNILKADAILGLKIDFDEISGGGKSMFMVSASGTAVFLEDPFSENRYGLYRKLNEITEYFAKGFMTEDEFIYEKERIISYSNNPISHEIKVIKEKIDYDIQIAKEKKEAEALYQQAQIEESKKTFVFNGFNKNS